MQLKYAAKFILIPKPPFHFDGTFHKPSHFPNNLPLEDWVPGEYWQTLRLGKSLYAFKAINKGTSARPTVEFILYSRSRLTKGEREKCKQEISWRCEFGIDLKEFRTLAQRDKKFYPIFKKWLGMRNLVQFTLYELLIIAIVLQNATVRRSQQMLDALLAKYGIKLEFDKKTL